MGVCVLRSEAKDSLELSVRLDQEASPWKQKASMDLLVLEQTCVNQAATASEGAGVRIR